MRFDNVFNAKANKEVTDAWSTLNTFHLSSSETRLSRSCSQQAHVGVWEQYSSFPMVTLDSKSQTPEACAALDRFLMVIGQLVVPRLMNLLYRHDHQNWMQQQK